MKGTGAKRNACPGYCVSTGAKFPVAPVESAPMNLCLKCIKIRLVAGLRPDPLGELMHASSNKLPPVPLAAMGTTSKGDGRQERGDGNDGKGIPQSQGE